MALEAGTRVGSFEISKLLGKGSMGFVYLADPTIGHKVAIKRIRKRLVVHEAHNERLTERDDSRDA